MNYSTNGGDARQKSHQPSKTAAAIDLGTYGCRMLLGSLEYNKKRRIVAKFSQTVRLSVTQDGLLTSPSKSRLFRSLIHCRNILERNDISDQNYKCVGTAACRSIKDQDGFIGEVLKKTGIKINIISSREEIELACIGSMSLFAKQKQSPFKLVFDMGGGSTDCGIFVTNPDDLFPKCIACASLPYGLLSSRNSYMQNPSTRNAVTHHTRDVISNMIAECNIPNPSQDIQVISTSGPLATIVTLNQGLKGYHGPRIHGFSISYVDTMRWINKLEQMCESNDDPAEQHVSITGVLPVLRGVMDATKTKAYTSNTGLRYGLLRKLLAPNSVSPQ
jgi:exopolyphosphatase/guanosine-5'-triphosphate,3'-diphosphate pyrophosphatase